MIVKINGKDVKVAVSDGGMFHDEETKTVSATTLKGLVKKLREAAIPKSGIPVIHGHDKEKKGVVTGRASKTGWRRRYFLVRWENGQTEDIDGDSLVKLASPLETENIKKAEEEVKAQEITYNEAYNKLNVCRNKLYCVKRIVSMKDRLEAAFPLE